MKPCQKNSSIVGIKRGTSLINRMTKIIVVCVRQASGKFVVRRGRHLGLIFLFYNVLLYISGEREREGKAAPIIHSLVPPHVLPLNVCCDLMIRVYRSPTFFSSYAVYISLPEAAREST